MIYSSILLAYRESHLVCIIVTILRKQRINSVNILKSLKCALLMFQKSGIDKIIPNMVIDDFLFEPCGYSMNGVTKNVSIFYMFLNIDVDHLISINFPLSQLSSKLMFI